MFLIFFYKEGNLELYPPFTVINKFNKLNKLKQFRNLETCVIHVIGLDQPYCARASENASLNKPS